MAGDKAWKNGETNTKPRWGNSLDSTITIKVLLCALMCLCVVVSASQVAVNVEEVCQLHQSV